MAVSTISYPEDFVPAWNPVQFVFSSTNVAECDFNIVADLYVNGVFAIRLKAFPEGANDYCYLRIEEALQDYLTYNFYDNLTGFSQNKQSICSYYLEVRERYNTSATCTGSSTLSAILHTTSTRFAWNGALPFKLRPYYQVYNYTSLHSFSKFLTNSPTRIIIPSDGEYTLYFLQNNGVGLQVDDVVIKTYNRFGTLLGTYVIDNTFNLSSPDYPEDYHLAIGVGPEQLNDSTLSSGVQPVYHADVHYYSVQLRRGTDIISETKEFQIDNRCTIYDTYTLCWWNRLGGVDYMHFPMKSTRAVDITRSAYNKVIPNGYVITDRGEKIMSVSARERMTFTTNWLTEEEGLWLEELFTSPEVFLKIPATTTSYGVSGVVHRASNSTADFVLPDGVIIPSGTAFTYSVDDGSPIGMTNTGSGTIVSYDTSTGYHRTTVASTINAGALITGSITVETIPVARVPVVVNSAGYDEKLKTSIRNIQYTIDVKPSYKTNIQTQ